MASRETVTSAGGRSTGHSACCSRISLARAGARQLHLFTANSAGAQITVRDCVFCDAGEYAVSCVMRRTDYLGESFGYFKQTKLGDGQYDYEFVDDSAQPFSFNSTVLHVDRCAFVRCRTALVPSPRKHHPGQRSLRGVTIGSVALAAKGT